MHPIAARIAARRTAAKFLDVWRAQFPDVLRAVKQIEGAASWAAEDIDEAAHIRRRPNQEGANEEAAKKLADVVRALAEMSTEVAKAHSLAQDLHQKLLRAEA